MLELVFILDVTITEQKIMSKPWIGLSRTRVYLLSRVNGMRKFIRQSYTKEGVINC